jgi:hypothetical protein
MSRIPVEEVFPDRLHVRGCWCACCATRRHPNSCDCRSCDNRRYWEGVYLKRQEQLARQSVLSNLAAERVARLGLTRRELAEALSCSLSTAQRASTAGEFISRGLERRVLALRPR